MSTPGTAPAPTTIVTFLFTDIEGSTERWEKHREAMAVALERHDACLRGPIEAHGGTVFKTIGDAFQAAFPNPVDALLAAITAQRALAAEDWSACGDGFLDLRVRMALHLGPAVPDERGDYRTPLLNRVARIESAGHGGQVLLSSDAAAAIAGRLPASMRLRDLGEHRLKDLRHAERIVQVVAEGMPDVTRALRSAGELGARDRIIVRDPTGEGADTLAGRATVVERTVAETFADLLSVLRGDERTVVLTAEQVRAAAQHRPADVTEYRLGRIAEWSQPRYRLDGRFVDLTLLVDQGEESVSGRWAAKQERYDDLGALLAAAPDPSLVVLGPPGSGKSTLLRRLELDTAIEALRGADKGADRLTFFTQLNQYTPPRLGAPLPAPGEWLAERWSSRFPDLPPLDDLLADGRMVLLLDALNEMPAAIEREMRQRVGMWKAWLQRLAAERPGNRVVFSCRSLDYSQPLSTPALRVPQVQIEPLSDGQVKDFLRVYSPSRWREAWAALEGAPQLEVLRSPYFLKLLVDQVEATGAMPEGRAALFTGFVRQALRREVERGSALFESGDLLAGRDLRRLSAWQWATPWDLPERGELVPKLAALAHGMQAGQADGERSQVRIHLDDALDLLDSAHDEAIVAAGEAMAVLDEDQAAEALMYAHQLVQEYFAARALAKAPSPELARTPWRAAEVRPTVDEVIDALDPADPLPPLPSTGWEETTVLAAGMAEDAEAFLRGVMGTNLALSGRCAAQAGVRDRLGEAFLDELRWALVERSRDPAADLRDRIACGDAVGDLGDPRFERRMGPYGAYLMPPMVEIAGGMYPIGDDEPIEWALPGLSGTDAGHVPRHAVEVAAFRIGQFPVTNAEWACFIAAGGYEDERWWDTEGARAWRRGELANEGAKSNNRRWRRRFQENSELLEQMVEEGRLSSAEAVERWRGWMALDDAAFEAVLDAQWQAKRETEPLFWRDARFNRPNQPVVGVSWYEACAYCRWLGAQTGLAIRLPTEVEWEAAAGGRTGRQYAWGDDFDRLKASTFETRVKRTTPVGVFVEGDTPEGVADLSGNVNEWTSSLWGMDEDEPEYRYPYDATDGREDAEAAPDIRRVMRGGSWGLPRDGARAAARDRHIPGNRHGPLGVRVASLAPVSLTH